MKKKICCIGHITHDRIITPDFTAEMPGGTAYYFAKALQGIAPGKFNIVTAVGPEDMNVVNDLRSEGIEVMALPSEHTVFFENRYGENMDERTQRVLAKAQPFNAADLQKIDASYFHLGTLLADDFSLDLIKELSTKGMVAVDIQGYLRRVEGEAVVHQDYDLKREAMPYISVLKCNEIEMEVLTGEKNPYKAAETLASWGCNEVVLTFGSKGSYIMSEGKFHEIPPYPPTSIIDATGCGDTYMAGYLYRRNEGDSIQAAAQFASAMCSLKLACKGPLNASVEDIRRLMRR